MSAALAELDRDQWQRLNQLLADALTLDDAGRERWLASLRGESGEVLAVLRQLLTGNTSDRGASRFGDSAALAQAMFDAIPEDDQPGESFGPYRLHHVLGRGGMSTVWAAERSDGQLRRTVALKIPHAEWSDHGLAERLARECKVLAELNHPSIAHLYDAGTTAAGRPYLALELVEGETIDRACAQRGLDLRARVRLFIEVLRAVAYAHARLVVHRDLKPANILVTALGQVKLLDFGIAKMLNSDTGSAEETELTRIAGRPLTLAYAAPEQVQGGSITTATDLYSLGAVLYELLTGVRATLPRGETRAALEQAILAGRPALPSAATRDAAAASQLHGDLDAVLLKALATAPEARYATAEAFANDLDRFLDGRPVQARLASRRYRLERFLARNRLAVGTAVAIAVALVAGLTVALWQAHEAARQAGIAAQERDRALAALESRDAVDAFMSDLLQEAGRAGRPVPIPQLIERADQLSAREFADAPERRAAVLRTVAEFRVNTEGIAPALDYLDQAARLTADSRDSALRAGIGCSRALLGGVARKPVDEQPARAALEALAGAPDTPAQTAAECLSDLAQLELYEYDGKAAGQAAQRGLAVWSQSTRRSPVQHVQLEILSAEAKELEGSPLVAEAIYRRSLEQLTALGRDRGDWGLRARQDLIRLAFESGDPVGALGAVDDAIALARSDLGTTGIPGFLLQTRASLLATLERDAEAEQAFRQLAGATAAGDRLQRIRALAGIAASAARQHHAVEAGQAYRQASEELAAGSGGADPITRFAVLRSQAELDEQTGRFEPAIAASTAALAVPGMRAAVRAMALRTRAAAQIGLGRYPAALRDASDALAIDLGLRGDRPCSAWVAKSAAVLALAEDASHQAASASLHREQAQQQFHCALGDRDALTLQARELGRHARNTATDGPVSSRFPLTKEPNP